MHVDPFLPRLVGALAVLLVLAIGLRRLRQPAPVVYLIAGLVLGPEVLDWIDDVEAVERVGEYGVLLLLFVLGTEISLPMFLANWRVPVVGIVLQVGLSLAVASAVGAWLGWPLARTVLVTFVISLSSTALVLKLLQERGETDTETGRDAIAILLAQDLAVAPMLIVLGLLGGHVPTPATLGLQAVVVVFLLGLVAAAGTGRLRELPGMHHLRDDSELHVFAALLLALVLALLSGVAGLSAPFGAFVGGIVVGASPDVRWIHASLDPLRTLLLAVFLMSVGALVDLSYLAAELPLVVGLALAALVGNTLVNGVALRVLGRPWGRALLGGALLAQIGEFSFVLIAVSEEAHIIQDVGRQLAISVIVVTLVLGAAWIALVSRVVGPATPLAATE